MIVCWNENILFPSRSSVAHTISLSSLRSKKDFLAISPEPSYSVMLCTNKLPHFITVSKKRNYMAVVKRVCGQEMRAAQEEVKNSPGYIVSGEVANKFVTHLFHLCSVSFSLVIISGCGKSDLHVLVQK